MPTKSRFQGAEFRVFEVHAMLGLARRGDNLEYQRHFFVVGR